MLDAAGPPPDDHAWSDEQVRFLAAAGAILASALDYEQILARIARLAVPYLADWCVVALADEARGPRRVAIACADPARQPLADALGRHELAADLPYAYPHVIRTGVPQLLAPVPPDYFDRLSIDPEYRALMQTLAPREVLTLPLVVRGETRGAITLVMADSRRQHTTERLALAMELARRTAVTVDNALLFRAAQRRLAEMALIQRVARAISSALHLDEICHTVVEQISTAFGYRLVSIYLREGDNLVLQHQVGYHTVKAVIGPGEGVSSRVLRTGRTAFVRDLADEPTFIAVLPEIRQGIIVPLRYADQPPLGVLAVEGTGKPALTDDDLALLALLADQVSVAVVNARLFGAVEGAARRFQSLIAAAGSVIICLGPDLRVSEFNQEAERLYGISRADAIGAPFPERFLPAGQRDWAAGLARAAFAGKAVRPFETQMRDAAGQERSFVWTLAVRRGGAGSAEELLVIGQDITDQRQAEEARLAIERKLFEAQRLESLGVLAGGIAHDFNNLLAAIMGNAGLLRMDLKPGSTTYESAVQIELVAERAAELVGQMLAYAGRGRFVVEPIDLNATVREMIVLLQASVSKGAELRERLAADLPPIMADPAQVRQVVMNLIVNASEALGPGGGAITIVTRRRHVGPETPFESQPPGEPAPGEYVELTIADTGSGMDETTRARIFDPFFTTKFTGRGLGLAAVLGIVRGHRGALRVESAVGLGSSFVVLFPALANAAVAAPRPPLAAPAPEPSPDARPVVLVIDDEAVVRRMVSRVLTRGGYEVLCAADGDEGLALAASTRDLAAALIDLTMPRRDGEQVFRQLRASYPDLPIALMSGYSVDELSDRFGDTPPQFLHKPFSAPALIDLVGRLVAQAAPR